MGELFDKLARGVFGKGVEVVQLKRVIFHSQGKVGRSGGVG